MKLPEDSIGISDLLGWRECPARFEFGMRRHTEPELPGATNGANAYGSCIHDAIHLATSKGLSDEQAIEQAWPKYAAWLDPEHLTLLKEDLDSYRGGVPIGYELIAAETDRKVPLFVYDGTQIFFRFKIDALYRRVDDPTSFYMRDYKSSQHRKTQKEVDEDLQMWSYNFALHELYPECASLLQSYEQLRFGNLTTAKNAEQRAQMKQWLVKTATAVLKDEELKPRQNQFCPWCPLAVGCSETERSTRFWKGRLAVLAPQTKEGRKIKIEFADEGDDLERLIEKTLPQMLVTRKHMDHVEKELKRLIEELPSEERERLGWRLADRKTKMFSEEGLRMVHEALGDDFYRVVTLSRSAVDTLYGKPKKGESLGPEQQAVRDAELERVSTTTVVPND